MVLSWQCKTFDKPSAIHSHFCVMWSEARFYLPRFIKSPLLEALLLLVSSHELGASWGFQHFGHCPTLWPKFSLCEVWPVCQICQPSLSAQAAGFSTQILPFAWELACNSWLHLGSMSLSDPLSLHCHWGAWLWYKLVVLGYTSGFSAVSKAWAVPAFLRGPFSIYILRSL